MASVTGFFGEAEFDPAGELVRITLDALSAGDPLLVLDIAKLIPDGTRQRKVLSIDADVLYAVLEYSAKVAIASNNVFGEALRACLKKKGRPLV